MVHVQINQICRQPIEMHCCVGEKIEVMVLHCVYK